METKSHQPRGRLIPGPWGEFWSKGPQPPTGQDGPYTLSGFIKRLQSVPDRTQEQEKLLASARFLHGLQKGSASQR